MDDLGWFPPAALDVLLSLLPLMVVAFTVVALVNVARMRHRSTAHLLGWITAVIFFPVFGAIAWFSLGRSAVLSAREFARRLPSTRP